ncbi:DUF6473 family protein [Ruegeria halocynthiae]|uniref:DUF6473 family protein n=1 Tax=Ruegeria halocynthiae TaxID=985054 RepID=UPI00055F4185|nr:DUF6473 family protein [Ruegeria halocynthiae]
MSYHQTGSGGPEDAVCQYDGSRLWFRGPRRVLDLPYMACVGGEETHGRFVEYPFAAILEERLGQRCVNFGSLFCGVDALCGDEGLVSLLNGAELCILQTPNVLGQSNHFYRVHPRRNDRVLAPTDNLVDLYPEIDFTDVHFVRHLMARLRGFRDARFEVVAEELRRNWAKRISSFLRRLQVPVFLMHLRVQHQMVGEHQVEEAGVSVTDQMLEALRPYCVGSADVNACVSGQSDELEDLLFGTLQQPLAEHMIGPATHRSIANMLIGSVRNLN